MIVLSKDLVVAVYNTLIERPFKEVAHVAVPLFQQMDSQLKALESRVETEMSTSQTPEITEQPTA